MKFPKHLALADMYAGHLHRKCSADSTSPQLVQRGLLLSPIVCRCLLRGQWPVRIPVILLIFFLLRDRMYFVFLALILMQFFDCLACSIEFQWLKKVIRFHLIMWFLRKDEVTFTQGSGVGDTDAAPDLARSSAISFPCILLWPGTQIRLTWLLEASFWT